MVRLLRIINVTGLNGNTVAYIWFSTLFVVGYKLCWEH
jgi:hypothetical protein